MLTLRPARRDDSSTLLGLIRELAEYEKLLDQVDATAASLERALFGSPSDTFAPKVFADVAEWTEGGTTTVAGFALWFYNFSTFRGRHGLYLEDLYVRPGMRGRGIGKALLVNLARRCVEENLARLEWAVLDWNTPARKFYESLGAQGLTEWVPHRVTGEALQRLAAQATPARPVPPRS
jgi:GNAT superfamily N-acetyltransferase